MSPTIPDADDFPTTAPVDRREENQPPKEGSP